MGLAVSGAGKHDVLDVACTDCHGGTEAIRTTDQWPERYASLRTRVRFAVTAASRFVVTRRRGTPLDNVEWRPDGAWVYPRAGGEPHRAPPYTAASHPSAPDHRRLECSACHSRWAPQCYGCHERFDPAGKQWDFVERRETPGEWHERGWDSRAELPTLGVDAANRIVPVVPGMIMTVEHPTFVRPLFIRRFAALEPHTTGRARSCDSCHRSSLALGLGSGTLSRRGSEWSFAPARAALADGLPGDAWTDLRGGRDHGGSGGVRPFTTAEILRILTAPTSTPTPPTRSTARP
ncbi:MAG: hypothetical protein JSR54_20515 [Proteobacteria bacterium]|nr:hypothetical protein [Pseudomonadota bacterium]